MAAAVLQSPLVLSARNCIRLPREPDRGRPPGNGDHREVTSCDSAMAVVRAACVARSSGRRKDERFIVKRGLRFAALRNRTQQPSPARARPRGFAHLPIFGYALPARLTRCLAGTAMRQQQPRRSGSDYSELCGQR